MGQSRARKKTSPLLAVAAKGTIIVEVCYRNGKWNRSPEVPAEDVPAELVF
jgi:hypothetical protein